MAEIDKVGVLGAGLMCHGIAQVAAQAGYEVVLREVDEATLIKGVGKIEKQLARAVEKGKSSQEDADGVRGRIHGTVDYGDLAEVQIARKREDYFAAGTAIVWDVDTKAELIHVYRNDVPNQPTTYRRGQDAPAEPAVPGWHVEVGWVFG